MSVFFLSHCLFLSQHNEEFIFLFFAFEFRKEIGLVNDAAFWIWPAQTPDRRTKNEKPCLSPLFSSFHLFNFIYFNLFACFLILNFEFDFNSFEFSCLILFKLKEKF